MELIIYGEANLRISGYGGCRKTITLGEAVLGLRRLCARRYGTKVRIRFVGTNSQEVTTNKRIAHLLFKYRKSLPIVMLDDKVICKGELPKLSIYEMLDRELE